MALNISMDSWDRKWSKLVRERDRKCLNCGKVPPYQLQAHHVMPRGRYATRWVVRNGITLCAHCHTLGPHSVHRVGKQFVINLLGKVEYRALEKMSLAKVTRVEALKRFKHEIDNT